MTAAARNTAANSAPRMVYCLPTRMPPRKGNARLDPSDTVVGPAAALALPAGFGTAFGAGAGLAAAAVMADAAGFLLPMFNSLNAITASGSTACLAGHYAPTLRKFSLATRAAIFSSFHVRP